MSSLASEDKSRVRWHLAYNESVPAGDRALLEDRMNKVFDNFTVAKIVERLRRCDDTEVETESDLQSTGAVNKRIILGDVNRTDVEYRAESLETRWRAYRYECKRLAQAVGVRNWNDPEMEQYREYTNNNQVVTVPSPVDVTYQLTLGSDLYLYYA